MCRNNTERLSRFLAAVLGIFVLHPTLPAQVLRTTEGRVRPDWRHVGNGGIDLMLASPASGPVERAWFSPQGDQLFVQASSGRVFETTNFEKWTASTAVPPPRQTPDRPGPESALTVKAAPADPVRLYALARRVLRSDDGGRSWAGLTTYAGESIIGDGMRDLAVSPANADEVVVVNDAGVWRSLDAGVSWTGLNESLPNLPVRKLVALPSGTAGLRALAGDAAVVEWAPGEKQAWKPITDRRAGAEAETRRALSVTLNVEVTAYSSLSDYLYAGARDGRIWYSADKGRTWTESRKAVSGPVEAIYSDPKEPRVAVAAAGQGPGVHALRTVNGGLFWDDLTADLPDVPAHGIAADRASGAIYIATDRGVFYTKGDLAAAGPATNWTSLSGLPEAAAVDVKLDAEGNQIYVALQGYGVYAAMAPHRSVAFRLVNSADMTARPVAPGSLLSVLGLRVQSATAQGLSFPVLTASDAGSQIQVPFEAAGTSIRLLLDAAGGSKTVGVPLRDVSPAIFIDRDGAPLLLNADNGVMLDGMNPARSNSRVEILASGFGKVKPDWPAGVPAPLEDPPKVVAPIRAYLDRAPVDVTRAVLAPGYVGLYLVEIQMPPVVNAGFAEFYLESGDQQSNRVRVYLEP
jgi:uncharacterized protein (TIGR03437 family)